MLECTPGPLLRIPDDRLEKEWRRDLNITHWRGDVWWYLGLLLWSRSIYRRWGGDPAALALWLTGHLACCLFPLAVLVAAPATYRRHRLPLLAVARVLRAAGIFLFITPNQNAIWPAAAAPASPFAAAVALLLSQYFKVAYLVCQSLAHTVPLKHHVWLTALSAAAALHSVPARCAFDCGASPGLGAAAAATLARLRATLGPLWIISFATRSDAAGEGDPGRACTVVQAWLLLTLGVVLPMLCFASVEEGWKARFLAERGHPRVDPPAAMTVAYDLAVAAAAAVVALQAVLLVYPS